MLHNHYFLISTSFLLALAFRATKILLTLRADILVAFRATYHLKDTMLPVKVINEAFGATKILPTVGVDIPVDCRFQSYPNPVNGGS